MTGWRDDTMRVVGSTGSDNRRHKAGQSYHAVCLDLIWLAAPVFYRMEYITAPPACDSAFLSS